MYSKLKTGSVYLRVTANGYQVPKTGNTANTSLYNHHIKVMIEKSTERKSIGEA